MSRKKRTNEVVRQRRPSREELEAAAGVTTAGALDVLDLRIGDLRVRCAAALALDPENCLEGTDAHVRPGDLLIEEGEGDYWHGAVIVRQTDREALRAALALPEVPPAAGGGA